jgi:DNA helicase-2/ATP-dependent DNA helicase PcrA
MDPSSTLNPDQRRAVEHFVGPAIVLSGPGSGKTRVITHRIVNLIKKRGVAPAKILAVTFTNKAANEMKERVLALLGKSTPPPAMGTFHSVCARILREDGGSVGLGRVFVIFDEADSFSLVKEVMKDLDIDSKQFSPGSIKGAIENAKNELVDEKAYAGLAQGFFQEEVVSKVYTAYQRKLQIGGATGCGFR